MQKIIPAFEAREQNLLLKVDTLYRMECPLTVFRSQSTLEGVNKSINNSSPLYCQRAASRRREAAWRQPYKAVRGSSKAE